MRLFLFNPDNDIALAAGTANFTAPPAAVSLGRAGELLPFFLASADDVVCCNGVNAAWFDNFRNTFNLQGQLWNHDPASLIPTPWGWSLAAKRRFLNLGFSPDSLPSDETVDVWRALSHRRSAADIGNFIASHAPLLRVWPRAVEVFNETELREALAALPRAVIKQPWSSSGRGVRFFDAEKDSLESVVRQSLGTIRRQGSVMVEKFLPDHSDFALLFRCDNLHTRFIGPSVCRSDDKNGSYAGNVVAPDSFLFDIIHRHIAPSQLELLTESLVEAITQIIAPTYSGPLGVDICVTGDPFSPQIHICEINLRYTMGFVARGIAPRIPCPALLSVTASPIPPQAVSLSQPGPSPRFILTPIA